MPYAPRSEDTGPQSLCKSSEPRVTGAQASDERGHVEGCVFPADRTVPQFGAEDCTTKTAPSVASGAPVKSKGNHTPHRLKSNAPRSIRLRRRLSLEAGGGTPRLADYTQTAANRFCKEPATPSGRQANSCFPATDQHLQKNT